MFFGDNRRFDHGVIKLIEKVFGSNRFSSNPFVNANGRNQSPYSSGVVFSGRNRLEAKRALLRYWSRNRQELDCDFRELQERCRMLDDDRTIVLEKDV